MDCYAIGPHLFMRLPSANHYFVQFVARIIKSHIKGHYLIDSFPYLLDRELTLVTETDFRNRLSSSRLQFSKLHTEA